jgi:hypothetical protein
VKFVSGFVISAFQHFSMSAFCFPPPPRYPCNLLLRGAGNRILTGREKALALFNRLG